jgi:hypothetical protein
MLAGKWTYRSYFNSTELVGNNADAALALIFGEGIFDLTETAEGKVTGTLDMGDASVLTLDGEAGADGSSFSLVGLGVPGTSTEGWRYDYRGHVGYVWPNAVDQVRSLLGIVIRVYEHGPHAPAGVTASFIAASH